MTHFRTRSEVERYFAGATITCLVCKKRFRRLAAHLVAKHRMTSDDYKDRFGLPWTRGLTCAPSRVNSGWTEERRAEARKRAHQTKFFEFAHPSVRRDVAEFLKVEVEKNLGPNSQGFGEQFAKRVRALFMRGLTDAEIAKKLDVNRMTVNIRTRRWRKSKRVSKRGN